MRSPRPRPISMATAGPIFTWRATLRPACFSATITTAPSPSRGSKAASRSARTARNRPAWASASAISMATARSIFSRRTSAATLQCCTAITARASSAMSPVAGLVVETRYVGWGAGIVDLDNDGLADLFFATGMVYPEVEPKLAEAPYKSPNVLFRNLGNGKFEELFDAAGPGILEAHSGRGVAFGDFDNDGDLDILIVNQNEPPTLLRNDVSGDHHWLKVRLIGVKSNRSAIGAQVIAEYGGRKQAQALLAQSSYLSFNDRRLHFGLGAAKSAKLEIRWPNGVREVIEEVAADQLVVIREGSGLVR